MRSVVRLLLSRIGQQHQPYSPVALRSVNYSHRFYSSCSPIASEERSGIWHVLKTYFGWPKLFNVTRVLTKEEDHVLTKEEDHVLTKEEVCVIVPEAEAYVIERYGRYIKTLTAGTHSLIPTMDKVAHVHSLKEDAINIHDQHAITKENVDISIDGVLCIKIVDPKLASYAVKDPVHSLIQLAHSFMGREIGKMTLDEIFEERDALNERILMRVNDAAKDWGLACLRYEIRNLTMSPKVKEAREMLAIAERKARAQELEAQVTADWIMTVNNAERRRISTRLAAQADARAILNNAYETSGRSRAMSNCLAKDADGV